MKEKLEKAIEFVAGKIVDEKFSAIEVQQCAQAALNLANALIGLRAKE